MDIHITRSHRGDKRNVCAVSRVGQRWMLDNMGRDEEEVRANSFVMSIESDGLEEFIEKLREEALVVEVN